MIGLSLVPIASDVPEYAETVVYKTYDTVGMAKIVANYADDLPRADVLGTEYTVRVKTVADSYGFNIMELKASAGLGTNLPTRKGEAARRAIEVKLNKVAMVGDAEYGLYGMTTHQISALPRCLAARHGRRQQARKSSPIWTRCGMRCAYKAKGCIRLTDLWLPAHCTRY